MRHRRSLHGPAYYKGNMPIISLFFTVRLLQRKFIVLFNTKKKMRESLTQTTVKKETGQNSPSQTVDFTDPFSYFQAEKSLAGKCEREKTKIKIFKVKYTQQNFYIYGSFIYSLVLALRSSVQHKFLFD